MIVARRQAHPATKVDQELFRQTQAHHPITVEAEQAHLPTTAEADQVLHRIAHLRTAHHRIAVRQTAVEAHHRHPAMKDQEILAEVVYRVADANKLT